MVDSYDYIVIGAGSAGAPLAARLSEDRSRRVLLLEAGPSDAKAEIHVPFFHTRLFKTDVDWDYYTEPVAELANRRVYWPRGKVLGGCSSCNFMIALRGHPADFDHWASLGNDGWDYASLLPFFRRLENHYSGDSEYHGAGGPVNVARLRCVNPITDAFVEAAGSVGIPRSEDHNGETFDGVDYVQVSQRDGRRGSVALSYLHPAHDRENLVIATHAQGTRIAVEHGRAREVTYLRDGAEHRARAAAEIVLSGGSINSAQLLLLSGIGPADELRALGIPVVHDLPGVGRGMRDHFIVPLNYHCRRPVSLANAELAENQDIYVSSHDGPLTSSLVEATAAVKTSTSLRSADLALNIIPNYFLDYGFRTYDGHAFAITVNLRSSQSTGSITLTSADPTAPPRITMDYLSTQSERDTLLHGIDLAREIAAAAALGPFRGSELDPGRAANTAEAVMDYVRAFGQTEFHPVSTCRMGSDDGAVVDSQLRVRGLEGLRIADASVMPSEISSPTNLASIMIGERAADLIAGSS
jgi:choline dehydrogenase